MQANSTTGEIFVFPGPYSKMKKSGQDLSRKFEDVYQEIPPYAVDIKTGELLNKTPDPILIKVGTRNIFEYIQSFKDDVDIYKILEKVAISGDDSFLNRRIGQFGDFVMLPDNINDLNSYIKSIFDNNTNVPKDILDAAINSSIVGADLEAIIAKHVNQAVIDYNEKFKKGDE